MRDENFCTLGGRITHPPSVYPTKRNGWILAFSIANHAMGQGKEDAPLFIDVKVPGPDKQKLEEFAAVLPKGRKVTIYNGQLQPKTWMEGEIQRKSYQLFCFRLDQIWLRELPRGTTLPTPSSTP